MTQEPLNHMAAEHSCWLVMCDELKLLGLDINDQDKLNDLIIDWGERLAQLRQFTGQVYTNGRPQIF